MASSESGLQHALNGFVAGCEIAGIKISTPKTEVLHLLRNPDQKFSANWRCIIEAGREVQVSWDRIHE